MLVGQESAVIGRKSGLRPSCSQTILLSSFENCTKGKEETPCLVRLIYWSSVMTNSQWEIFARLFELQWLTQDCKIELNYCIGVKFILATTTSDVWQIAKIRHMILLPLLCVIMTCTWGLGFYFLELFLIVKN